MGARQNNPPAYVVYDRSFQQNVSTTESYAPTTVGQASYMIDSNLSTFYAVISTGDTPNVGKSVILIDYGQVYWNCQLSYFVNFSIDSVYVNYGASCIVEYSTDGTNWTNLTNTSVSNVVGTTKDVTLSTTILNLRYVRFSMTNGSTGQTTSTLKVYENRLMGSGF